MHGEDALATPQETLDQETGQDPPMAELLAALHEIADRTQMEVRCSVLMDWASQISMPYQYERYQY